MPAIPNQVHNNIAAECVAIVQCHPPDAHDGIHIFTIHVEDGNRLPQRKLSGEAGGMFFIPQRSKAEEVVGNDVNRAAYGVAGEIRQVQRLRSNSLPRECGITMDE